MSRPMNKIFRGLACALTLFLATWVHGQPLLDHMHHGMELSIVGDYDRAIAYFDSLLTEHPDNLMATFFRAAVWQSRMMDFESELWSKEFHRDVEGTIRLAHLAVRRNPGDRDAHFFLGAAFSYKSFQLARDKKYLSAFQTAVRCLKELDRVTQLDSAFCDTYLGIGSYQYWRSQITRKFSWLPFFADRRMEGIRKIRKAYECGLFTRWAALSNLAWIYIEEKNYAAAITCAAEGLSRFPGSRFFLWPMGDAQFKNGEYAEAAAYYQAILNSVRSEPVNNHYNETLLLYKLACCHQSLGEVDKARDECMQALALPGEGEAGKRIKNKKELVARLLGTLNGAQ